MIKENDIIIDSVFGRVIYNGYDFQRAEKPEEETESTSETEGDTPDDTEEKLSETTTLFNEEYELILIVKHVFNEATSEFMISDAQKEIYKKYQDILTEEEQSMTQAIEEYAQMYFENFDLTEDLEDYLEPTHLYINTNAQLGILFETKYDEEHGLALFFLDDKTREIRVDHQNLFI